MDISPGFMAGPYRVIGPLGKGGMASVYRAHDTSLEREVALKVLPREFLHDGTFSARFRREAQVIAQLEHPNVVPIYAYDIDTEHGVPWMAMRLVGGGSLTDQLRRGRPSPGRAVEILRGVADALEYAHGKGIVHRDVKPQNILLDESGRVYLADFGIARILEAGAGLTATGTITGTPQYMAPEQATGTKVDHRADIYALAIVAYELFTGQVPFTAETPVGVLMKQVQEPLPLPGPEVLPPSLMAPIQRGAAKPPGDRHPTAGALVDALGAALGGAAEARGPRPETLVPPPTVPRPAVDPDAPTRVAAAPGRPPDTGEPTAGTPGVPDAATRRSVPERSTGEGTAAPAAPGRRSWLPWAAGAVVGAAVLMVPIAGFLMWRGGTEPEKAPAGETDTLPARRRTTSEPAYETGRSARRATPEDRDREGPDVSGVKEGLSQLERVMGDLDRLGVEGLGEAAEALGGVRDTAVAALETALASPSPQVRREAAEALGDMGPAAEDAVPALIRALEDPDAGVREEAAQALGRIGDEEAIPALERSLDDASASVRRAARRSLERIREN